MKKRKWFNSGIFFAWFFGECKQVFVRDFELDDFLDELDKNFQWVRPFLIINGRSALYTLCMIPRSQCCKHTTPFPFSLMREKGQRVVCLQHWLLGIMHSVYNALLPLHYFMHFLVSYMCGIATSCCSRAFLGQLFVQNFDLGQIFFELDEN